MVNVLYIGSWPILCAVLILIEKICQLMSILLITDTRNDDKLVEIDELDLSSDFYSESRIKRRSNFPMSLIN